MKTLKRITLALLLTAGCTIQVCAKQIKTDHMYMFGFSASFKDSTIYITDIQDVQGAWYETKTHFLMGRDNYSYQLKEYMTTQQNQPSRVCMVFFATDKKKAEKKYQKIKRKYTEKAPGMYDVKHLTVNDFKFDPIDFTPESDTEE